MRTWRFRVAFLPDGTALIAERDSGAIKHMSAPGVVDQVGTVPVLRHKVKEFLLGPAVSDQTVFAYITTGQDNRVLRMRFGGRGLPPIPALSEPTRVYTAH